MRERGMALKNEHEGQGGRSGFDDGVEAVFQDQIKSP